ncbi:MAG: DUF3857 domain-containing protein, partial [Acidobacteriota bacterium]
MIGAARLRPIALSLAGWLVAAAIACGAEPWRRGAFAAPAAELERAASEAVVGLDAPVVVLWDDSTFRFDAAGRLVFRRHWIYRVAGAEALEDWSLSQVRWEPWRQERPEVSARVVIDGQERLLAPERFEELPAPEPPEGRIGDRRLLQARLPGVRPGAVVEEEIIVRDRAPASTAGLAARHYFVKQVPVLASRLTLDAPKRLPLRYGIRRAPGLEPEREVGPERVRLTFETGDLPPGGSLPPGVPGHRPIYPHVAFSTGASWNAVARVFGEEIARAEAAGPIRLEDLGIDPAALARASSTERIDRIVEAVRARVVFDGAQTLDRERQPRPAATLEVGEGSPLDLAVLTRAALRQAGIEARIELVSAGFGRDVEPQLPGLGLFDHALLSLPREGDAGERTWIDPAHSFARAGELPLASQGRFVLTVDPSTQELSTTPVSRPLDNLASERRDVRLAPFGPGDLTETATYFGSAARTQRSVTAGLDAEARRRGYLAYARSVHGAAELGEMWESPPQAVDRPFEIQLEIRDSSLVQTDLDRAELTVPVPDLLRRLPAVFSAPLDAPRVEDFVFHEPFVTRWRYRIRPPRGFRLVDRPPNEELSLGPATFRQMTEVQ